MPWSFQPALPKPSLDAMCRITCSRDYTLSRADYIGTRPLDEAAAATTPSPAAHRPEVLQLREMFPTVDPVVIDAVLEELNQSGKGIDEAASRLLSMS